MVLNKVKDAINTRYFMDSMKVNITDSEIQAFYNENKDSIPNLLLSQGGVEAIGISFVSDKDAKEFVRKLSLHTWNEWLRYKRGELINKPARPYDIPSNPQRVYKKHDWKGIRDWLGLEK